ncbi:MAG: hypothetical protein IID05_13615 [Gemmatimonadetes bacterium]|nr:hypothetical protein [Gemmatimonadota bacterium]
MAGRFEGVLVGCPTGKALLQAYSSKPYRTEAELLLIIFRGQPPHYVEIDEGRFEHRVRGDPPKAPGHRTDVCSSSRRALLRRFEPKARGSANVLCADGLDDAAPAVRKRVDAAVARHGFPVEGLTGRRKFKVVAE